MRKTLERRKEKFYEAVGQDLRGGESWGMFALLALSSKKIAKIKEKLGIYMLENGRVNFGSLRSQDYEKLREIKKLL